jgi:hypothetical protein
MAVHATNSAASPETAVAKSARIVVVIEVREGPPVSVAATSVITESLPFHPVLPFSNLGLTSAVTYSARPSGPETNATEEKITFCTFI